MRLPKQKRAAEAQRQQALYGNKLDKFRTYASYHVLAVCQTAALKNVSAVFENPEEVLKLVNTATPKTEDGYRTSVAVSRSGNSLDKYFILCNGMQDVDFIVDSLTLETVVQGTPVSTGSQALVGINGEIVIREPHGIKFLNVYRAICTELNTNAENLCLIIKTVFVGETTSYGNTPSVVDSVTDVPPVYGSITNFKIGVTEMGSTYTTSFTQAVGGIAHLPALSSSAAGILVQGGGSIQDMLNLIASQYTQDAATNLKQLPPEIAVNKHSIKYRIVIDDAIKQVRGWSTNVMRNARQSAAGGNQPTIVPPNVSLDGAIQYVFDSCAEYLKQATANAVDSFYYRIITAFVSDAGSTEIVYRIVPHYFNLRTSVANAMKESSEAEDILIDKRGIVIYDYIFTGKNTDIESFDMQIDEGMGYFQLITNIQTISDKYRVGTTVTTGATPAADVATPDGSSTAGMQAAVGPGASSSQTRSSGQELSVLKEQNDAMYAKMWSVGAAKMGAVLRTRGHSGWLAMFAKNPFEIANADAVTFIDEIPDVYLNIKMPSSSLGTYQNTNTQTYEKFWFQGLWRVLKVSNSFSNDGSFITTLDLLIINPNPITARSITESTSGSPPPEGNGAAPAATPVLVPSKPFVIGSTNTQPTMSTASNATQLTKDFRLGSFTATSKVPPGRNQPTSQTILDNIGNLAAVLQGIKDALNISITIGSGYRNDIVNKAVGGAANSDHKLGEAVDFTSSNLKPKQIVDAILAMKVPFKQLILEEPPGRNPWVHLSVSRTKSANTNTVLHWQGGKYLPYKG